MLNEVSDNRLRVYLQNVVAKSMFRSSLNNLRLCGSRIIVTGSVPAVFLLSSGESAKLWGTASCRSPWACPHCTPRVMAQKGNDIACAIDAMAKWHKQYACMITFTLPHTKFMSCEDTLKILKLTWRHFIRAGNKAFATSSYTLKLSVGEKNTSGGKACGMKGDVHIYKRSNGAYGEMRENLQIKHSVRVYEFTYGENGWHPHIHALFWIPKDKFDSVVDYEDRLVDLWWHCVKHEAKKYYEKKGDTNAAACVDEFYPDWKKITADGHKSVYISKNKAGKPVKEQSSYYVAGWSADRELTGANVKTAREGHLTPFEILEKSYAAYLLDDTVEAKKWSDLFLEYARTTFGSRRVEYSKSGLTDIIRKYKKSEEYTIKLKKKCTDKAKDWHVVCWFSKQQWSEIFLINQYEDGNLVKKLLESAIKENAREEIALFLEEYDIRLIEYEHPLERQIVSGLFDSKLTA